MFCVHRDGLQFFQTSQTYFPHSFCFSAAQHQSLLNLNPICLEISVSHQAADISFKQTPLCFIWPALMGSYLVFSAYLLLPCGLRVMCHPNLIISDPDFHLHVGGLLNPIPGKLLCVRSLLKSYSVLRSLPEAVSASDMNAENQMCFDKHTIVHKVKGCTYINMHTFKHTEDHASLFSCSSLPVFLPLFLCLLTGLCPNLLCSLHFHLKSFKLKKSFICHPPSYTVSSLFSAFSTFFVLCLKYF